MSVNPIWVIEERGHGAFYQSGSGRHRHRRHLCLHGARRGHDLPGDRSSQFRARRDGDVLDLHLLAADAMGHPLLGSLRAHFGALVRRRHRDRKAAVQAAGKSADPDQRRRFHRFVRDHQQLRRPDLGLHHQAISDPVRLASVPRQPADLDPPGRHDRRHHTAADRAVFLLPVHADGPCDAGGRLIAGIGAAGRHQHLVDDRARLGHGGGDRLDRWHDDRAGGVPRTEHDAGRLDLRICRRRAGRPDQPVRRRGRRLPGRHLRESGRNLYPRRRQRTEAAYRAGADYHRVGHQTGWAVRPAHREASLIMSAIQEVVTEAPAVEAVPKRAMTLGAGTSLVMLAVLLLVPLLVKNFIIFQLTMLLIYGLAVLALNILTGGSGQFSLGQSAFYAVGAYTSAILMEHADINYVLTLPVAGIICFVFGFLFGLPALRLSGVYLKLATFALATAMPQLLKLGVFEYWTGGVQGLVVTKPDSPIAALFGHKISQDMWLYYFTLAISIAIYIFSVNLLKSRSGRAFMAIRDNEIAASAMGVDVALYKTLAFGVSAGITGVAGGLGAIAVQFVAPDAYTITLAISLFLGMVVGGVGWLPGSIVGSAFIIFVPNIAEGISKGLSGAVFGVLLFLVIFLVPHGARQVAIVAQQLIGKLRKN